MCLNLCTSSKKRREFGFTLIEVMMSVTILSFILLLMAATFPIAFRGQQAGRNYAQASLIVQHKIDQLRQAGYSRLNATALTSLGVIDSNVNPDGSFSFTQIDNLVDNGSNRGYFAPGTISSITLGQALPAKGADAPPLTKAVQVTVSISWYTGGGKKGSLSTHTIIAAR